MGRRPDPVAIVEAAYRIELGEDAWLRQLTAAIGATLDPGGNGVRFAPSKVERVIYQHVAAHVGAGIKLLERARGDSPDAIVSPRGDVEDGLEELATRESRDAIRKAVRRIDSARTREGRADPLTALALWQGLFAGRWSIVERFDSDGRRFYLLQSNEPECRLSRPLPKRQRQVLFYASLGLPNKEIAYALGTAPTTVGQHLSLGLKRIGLKSRTELVAVARQLRSAAAEPDS
ncbi:MAG: response regulator transcription factor [Myxococcales bacterium]|nr:response regulator transcription factor [Myxococcales bacterium]